MEHDESIGKMGYTIVEPGIRWHLCVSPTLVLARSSNAAAQLPYGSVGTRGTAQLPYGSGET
jgi:hypothetical protein